MVLNPPDGNPFVQQPPSKARARREDGEALPSLGEQACWPDAHGERGCAEGVGWALEGSPA